MTTLFHDRVKETSTTTGLGSITLIGAVTQFVSFTSRFALGDFFYYCIVGQTGSEWEVGKGYLSSSTVLVRNIVYESSNADTLVNLSAGTKDVFLTVPAERFDEIWTQGQQLAASTGQAMP
jgi:hypothetical protein